MHHLDIALSVAIPLRVYDIYERGQITKEEIEAARAFGKTLAAKGDVLLYGSKKKGEVADLFNRLAESMAIMAFAPGGVPFGEQTFDAQHLLAGFIGKEKADAFCEQVRLKGIQEEETEE
jgi:hypothetical protein